VGNIAVGGTGKTPMAFHVAETLRAMGCRTVLVSRGYHGEAEKSGGIVSDGRRLQMQAWQAGDEPFMLAMRLKHLAVPVVVGRDRYASGNLALAHFRPEVIVLDDAFQHIRLHRDVDLVMLDERRPLGNRYLMPRGVLREPPEALRRSHALVITTPSRQDEAFESPEVKRIVPHHPIFSAIARPYVHAVREAGGRTMSMVPPDFALKDLRGKKVFGFSGIARNERFRNTLQHLPCQLVGFLGFPDHHDFSREDLRRICTAARELGADWLATTLKDEVRIRHQWSVNMGLIVLDVAMDLGLQSEPFRRFLKRRLQ
jgi:tetraacyldisaccharide 4'-kinase